jgi:hypothetical protein
MITNNISFTVLFSTLLFLTACSPETPEQKAEIATRADANVNRLLSQLKDMQTSSIEPTSRELLIMKDSLNGVTCWSVAYGQNSTLSCLPDWMLTSSENKNNKVPK